MAKEYAVLERQMVLMKISLVLLLVEDLPSIVINGLFYIPKNEAIPLEALASVATSSLVIGYKISLFSKYKLFQKREEDIEIFFKTLNETQLKDAKMKIMEELNNTHATMLKHHTNAAANRLANEGNVNKDNKWGMLRKTVISGQANDIVKSPEPTSLAQKVRRGSAGLFSQVVPIGSPKGDERESNNSNSSGLRGAMGKKGKSTFGKSFAASFRVGSTRQVDATDQLAHLRGTSLLPSLPGRFSPVGSTVGSTEKRMKSPVGT